MVVLKKPTLKEDQRQVIEMMMTGYEVPEIARMLELTAVAIRLRIYRAKKRLGAKTTYQLIYFYSRGYDAHNRQIRTSYQ